jgi:hypothetical protein
MSELAGGADSGDGGGGGGLGGGGRGRQRQTSLSTRHSLLSDTDMDVSALT